MEISLILYFILVGILVIIGLVAYYSDVYDRKNGARFIFLAPIWPLCVIFFILLWIVKIIRYTWIAFKAAEWKTLIQDWWYF